MSIEKNIKVVLGKMEAACRISGREIENIKLLAVTKTHPSEMIEIALQEGIEFIAENKVQDASIKIPELQGKYKEFHFIGHLQSNKIGKLLKLNPALIHSIDKFETAAKINDILANSGRIQEILIQVNTSNEDSKSGVRSTETIELIKRISRLANVRIKGLMTIGAFTTDQENIRNCFRILRKLFDQIKKMGIINVDMRYLSMGMTGDFEIAIEEGANIIRIGSAIFGAREH